MTTDCLLTRTVVTPNREALGRRDQAALQIVEEWMANPQLERLAPFLSEMRRLQTFVSEEKSAR